MRKDELLALAACVEAAAGADRAMDAEIARAAGHKAHDRGKLGWTVQFNGQGIHHNLPAYSASLDAAASLVPAGAGWRAIYSPNQKIVWFGVGGYGPPYGSAEAATPALALCAAALRAMAEEASDE